MHPVHLIHWHAQEAEERVALLREAGYEAVFEPPSPSLLKAFKERPPAALVIDLSRLPSQGRDVALHMRKQKATRCIPLVFVEGAADKVARVRTLLPDAHHTTWGKIRGVLKRAISNPPKDPAVPDSVFDAYAGTPLPKKLGIKEHMAVALVNAPEDLESTLGELPAGVVLRRNLRGKPDLTLWFTTSRKELEGKLSRMTRYGPNAGLWIAWPKKASSVYSDLSQSVVRRAGLDAGLMDFKICRVDDTWSALRFTIPRDSSR
jgi:CheY-like chemotaxis protein